MGSASQLPADLNKLARVRYDLLNTSEVSSSSLCSDPFRRRRATSLLQLYAVGFTLAQALLVLEKSLELLLLRIEVVHNSPTVVVKIVKTIVNLVRQPLSQLACQPVDLRLVVDQQINDILTRLLNVLQIVHLLQSCGLSCRCG